MDALKSPDKPFVISKRAVWEAYEKVKANRGAPGVDQVSLGDFEKDLKGNLYKVWNRLSSGSYFPPPVRAVEISKGPGKGSRMLGVPTVADRIAQTVVAGVLEGRVEQVFHPDSYGYRPNRSALDAVRTCRERCWRYDWVIEFDIRSFFDSVRWDLVVKAVEAVCDLSWVLLYVKRWLAAPVQQPDGTVVRREKGTPQGSAISPVLANLFLHYAFDMWMAREYPGVPFVSRSSATQMMQSSTAAASPRPKWFWGRCVSGWARSCWNCTRTRRGSCTARTASGVAIVRTHRSRSWGSTSDRVGCG